MSQNVFKLSSGVSGEECVFMFEKEYKGMVSYRAA
jgi:hypothetical protein